MDRAAIDYLIKFFKELIQSEKTLQCIRKELNTIKMFHSLAVFDKIAGVNKSFITIQTMKDYLKERIAVNDRELYEIFEKFDHKRRGSIDREDFGRQLKFPGKKQIKYNEGMRFTYEMQSKFLEYISTIVKSCRVIDVWRQELMRVEPYIIFKVLDSNIDGRIGPIELFRFFLQNQERLTKDSAHFLYKILLKRHYKEVNLEVFCQNLDHIHVRYYEGYERQLLKSTQALIQEKQKKYCEALEQEQQFNKKLKDEKVIELVHKQASLLREHQLEERINQQRLIYQQLKYKTIKKYHPQLTYEGFLILEKENAERANLEKRLLQQEALKREAQYKERLMHVEVVREIQNFQRAKLQRLPFMTMQNRIDSSFHPKGKEYLQSQIQKHKLNQLRYIKRLSTDVNFPLNELSLLR